MITEVILPKLGQTMDEGAIVEWVKDEGDAIKRGDLLFTVYNGGAETQTATVSLDRAALGLAADVTELTELVAAEPIALDADGHATVTLPPDDLAIVAPGPG